MKKTVKIYSSIERDLNEIYAGLESIKGVKKVKFLEKYLRDDCFEYRYVYTYSLKCSFWRSHEIDGEIFRKFFRAIIFNERAIKNYLDY